MKLRHVLLLWAWGVELSLDGWHGQFNFQGPVNNGYWRVFRMGGPVNSGLGGVSRIGGPVNSGYWGSPGWETLRVSLVPAVVPLGFC